MNKSQAELDRAVIEAAGNLSELFDETRMRSCCSTKEFRLMGCLTEAVRARRAAMRPCKAEVIRRIFQEGHEFGVVQQPWSELPEAAKDRWRARLAEILAAPDEEQ